jgi:hypothetical protein
MQGPTWLAAGCLMLTLAQASCAATPEGIEPLERFPEAALEIESGRSHHAFQVWVAATPLRRAQGLSFVRRLDPGRGMLFLFDPIQYASFWMPDTYVSLDLLFIAPDGRIVNIIKRAQPLSTAPLESVAPVTGVLEVVAGTVERLGIRAGDRVLHPAFQATGAP